MRDSRCRWTVRFPDRGRCPDTRGPATLYSIDTLRADETVQAGERALCAAELLEIGPTFDDPKLGLCQSCGNVRRLMTADPASAVVRAATLALTESLELDVVLERLLDYLGRLVLYDSARVLLIEDETRLVVRALRGYERGGDPERARSAISTRPIPSWDHPWPRDEAL